MTPDKTDMLVLILQLLKEANLEDSVHALERETGLFFDMEYFEKLMLEGHFDEAEKYLSGFTNVHDNLHSTRLYFEIRKQKFLEALDRHQNAEAIDIIMNDFKVFQRYNDTICKDATLLLGMENFREHSSLANYGDPSEERHYVMKVAKQCLLVNPALRGKLQLPHNNAPAATLWQLVTFPWNSGNIHGEASTSDARQQIGFHL